MGKRFGSGGGRIIIKLLKYIALKFFNILAQESARREWLNQNTDTEFNELILDYRFVLQCIHHTRARTILDCCTGSSPLPSLIQKCGCVVTAIDQMGSYWRNSAFFNRHFYIIKDDITKPKLSATFDMVICIASLQHIPNHLDAVREMFNFLRPGGFLVLTFPYNELRYIENVYKLPAAGYGQDRPYICQVFSRQEVNSWLSGTGKILKQEYFKMFNGEFWTFEGRCHPQKVSITQRHHYTNILIQKKVDEKDKVLPAEGGLLG